MSEPSDARTTPTAQRFRELIGSVSSVVAPLTLITAILFYFGYASSRAQYAYFGLDIATIGLSTQDFVIRSPQPLLVPLLAIGLIGAAVALGHAAVRRRIATAHDTPRRIARLARLARGCSVLGWTALAAGVFLVLAYAWLRGWAYYPIVAPGVLAAGAALAGYGLKLDGLLGRQGPTRRATTWSVYVVLATSLFWATATVAELSGRGAAIAIADNLDELPSVVLDTKERLYLTTRNIAETALPQADGQEFHYRYRHLRLLIQGRDRLFLVPSTWSPSDSTLVVPMDDSVRLQFPFQAS